MGPRGKTKTPYMISPAGFRDLNAVRRVEQICFGKDAWPLIDIIGVLALPGIIRFKAEIKEQRVGFVAGEAKPWEGTGWIATIGVVPEYRRQGIALALMEECEQKMNLPSVKLCVRKSNDVAIELYKHLGYSQVEVWPNYYQDKEDAIVMERKR
jgi:ribosomal protein S18 acetylase RimI-like enzyme